MSASDVRSAFFDADRVSQTGLLKKLEEKLAAKHGARALQSAAAPASAPAPAFSASSARRDEGVGSFPPWGSRSHAGEASSSQPAVAAGTLYVIGLAYDECVRYTAEDAAVLAMPSASDSPFASSSCGGKAETFKGTGGGGKGDPHDKSRCYPFRRSRAVTPIGLGTDDTTIRWSHVAVIEDGTRFLDECRREEIPRTLEAMGVKVRDQRLGTFTLPRAVRCKAVQLLSMVLCFSALHMRACSIHTTPPLT